VFFVGADFSAELFARRNCPAIEAFCQCGRRTKADITRQTPRNTQIDLVFRKLKRDFKPINEAAREMGLQPITLRKYCQDNIFSNAQEFGREWVISQDDIDWWNANRRGKVGRPPANV
jgi:hypothetical protein